MKRFRDSKRMVAAIVTTAASSLGMAGGLYVGMHGHPPVITPDVFGWWLILLGSVWGTAIGTTGWQDVVREKNGHAIPAVSIPSVWGTTTTTGTVTAAPAETITTAVTTVAPEGSEVVEPEE